jgi:GAF domain-containing protein
LLLAAQAAATIERAMLAEQANRTERLELLNELVSKLNRLADERSVLETATEGIHASLPFAEVATVLYRPDESLSLLCFPEGSRLGLQLRRPCLKVNRTPFAVCMQERKSVILLDISVEKAKTPFERWLARRGFRSLIAVPLVATGDWLNGLGEQVLGVIFAAAAQPDAFSRDDLTFLADSLRPCGSGIGECSAFARTERKGAGQRAFAEQGSDCAGRGKEANFPRTARPNRAVADSIAHPTSTSGTGPQTNRR